MVYLCCSNNPEQVIVTPTHQRQDKNQTLSTNNPSSIVKVQSHKRSDSARSIISVDTQTTASTTTSTSMTTNSSSLLLAPQDPCAKQSKSIKKCNKTNLLEKINGCGDGDVWVEKRCIHKVNGKMKFLFVSENTGVVTREPPSGASRVVYADDAWKHRCNSSSRSESGMKVVVMEKKGKGRRISNEILTCDSDVATCGDSSSYCE